MRLASIRSLIASTSIALAWALSAAAQAAYSNVFFFGDSLSDTGNLFAAQVGAGTPDPLPQAPTYFAGRFSNDLLWTDRFAWSLGFDATPSLLGGNNFAWAGATLRNFGRMFPEIPQMLTGIAPGTDADFPRGLPGLLSRPGSRADPNALYVIMGGGNDIADALERLLPTSGPDAALRAIFESATIVGGMIDTLYAAGARNILVSNAPNVGLTPRAAEAGSAAVAFATALARAFNRQLDLEIGTAQRGDLDLALLDLFALQTDVASRPAEFGFSNVAAPCKPGDLGVRSQPSQLCSDPSSYFYWDRFHPSGRAHQLIADAALQAIPSPASWTLVAAGLLLLPLARRQRIH